MLFEHVEDPRRELCRIERDGTRVNVHHHLPGEAGRVEFTDHASFAEASDEYDRQIVRVYERGYRLVRDWVDPPLAHDATLEAMIAEDPYDESRWMVLADWILTRDDARAHIVRFEQSRRSHVISESWGQYPVQLFGGAREAELLTDMLARGEWQAGHVRQCRLELHDGDPELLAAFVAAPATRLVRDLGLAAHLVEPLRDALAMIAEAPCRPVLRRIHLACPLPLPSDLLDAIFHRRTAPALTTLGIELPEAQSITDVLDRLVASPLNAQLRVLQLGKRDVPPTTLAHRYGTGFAHLTTLAVRADDAQQLNA